jgi:methyltransferase
MTHLDLQKTEVDLDLLQVIICGATGFELLRTALEFDLFGRLEAAGGMDLAAIAATIGTEEQPARILLLGLASLKLITKDGPAYVNSSVARQHLVPGKPGYLGSLVEVHEKIVNRGIVDLAESMRRNTNAGVRRLSGSGPTLYDRLEADPELYQLFWGHFGVVSKNMFLLLMETFDFSRLRHIVDVGGGDGTNGILLAQRYPHLTVTVFEQARADHAERKAAEAGLAARVRAWQGDFFSDPFPPEIDGIIICHVFEMWSLDRNTRMLRNCYRALPPGGALLLYNYVSDDDNTGSLGAAFMSAYFMSLATGEGMVYSAADMEAALRAAGFSRVQRYTEGVGFDHALLVAYK